jgi:response regulator of citrate/malate metabolism
MVKKQRQVLNGKMRQILAILHKKGGEMTANELAAETGFSYKTVTKYLEELAELKIITRRVEHGNKNKTNKN